MFNEEPSRIMTNKTTHVIEKLELSKIMTIRKDLAKIYNP